MSWLNEDDLEDDYEFDDIDESEEDEFDDEIEIEIELPTPHSGQQKVLNSKARFKVLLCGRRWGKTLVSQIIAIKAMLDGKHVAYVTPEFGLGKDFFRDIMQYLPERLIKIDNKSELFIQLITGGSLRFFSGEALDSFRGRKFHLCIVDEAAFISDLENAWNGAIRPTLSDYRGEALFISTPKGQNYFYTLFILGQTGEKGFESFHFPSNTNPYFPKEEFEELKETTPEAKFREEYLAEPMESGGNAFGIKYINQNVIPALSDFPTIVYGIDLASSFDWTVIIGLDANGDMSYFDRFQLDWEATYERVKKLDENVLKVVDATGVGDVIYDRLAKNTKNIKPFKFTASTKPTLINHLINEVQKGNIKYIEIVAKEMRVFEMKPTSTGYTKYAAQSGCHDDMVCALAIANHFKQNAFNISEWKLYHA